MKPIEHIKIESGYPKYTNKIKGKSKNGNHIKDALIASNNNSYQNINSEELIHKIETEEYGSIHSISDIVESAKRNNGTVRYKDSTLSVDPVHKAIVLGNVKDAKDVITVSLSIGYQFSFRMKDVNSVRGMLSLFAPEDVQKILAAIASYNHSHSKLMEIEQNKVHLGESEEEIKNEEKKQRENPFDESIPSYKRMNADTLAASLFYKMSQKLINETSKEKQWKLEEEKQKIDSKNSLEEKMEDKEEVNDNNEDLMLDEINEEQIRELLRNKGK